MAERPNMQGVSITFRRESFKPLVRRWDSEGDFTAHLAGVAESAKSKCAKGAGECCMTLTLDSFDETGKEKEAVVTGQCVADDCPPGEQVAFNAAFDAIAGDRVSIAHPLYSE